MPTRTLERNMNLSQAFLWWRTAPARALPRPATPAWVNGGIPPTPEQAEAAPAGCGWFDSSHELHSGLQVTEHLAPERLANELPLGWWLDWQSRGAAPSVPGRRGLC